MALCSRPKGSLNLYSFDTTAFAPGAAIPGRIEVFDNNDQPVDWNNPANLRGNTANNANLYNRSYTNQGFVNVRRALGFLPVPAAVQVGLLEKRVMLDNNLRNETWTFTGPDGASGATAPIEPYLMQRYRGVDTGYGMPSINWMSPSRTFRAYQLNPLLYQQTDAQRVSDRNSHIDNNENIKERVQAGYIQADTRLLGGQLRVLGGVRYERTIDRGIGGLVDTERIWQRNPDGSFVRNSAGQRLRRTEAGAAGSLAESLLTREYRASFTKKEYDGAYPSIHATYNATENILVRAAWAKTYGRPNFTDIIPRTVANTSANEPTARIPACTTTHSKRPGVKTSPLHADAAAAGACATATVRRRSDRLPAATVRSRPCVPTSPLMQASTPFAMRQGRSCVPSCTTPVRTRPPRDRKSTRLNSSHRL